MKRLYTTNIEGINYYVPGGGTCINMTYDTVNAENYNDVSDINCFGRNEPINSYDDFELMVIKYISNDKLHEVIIKDLEKLYDFDKAYKIILKVESQAANRESYIMAEYTGLKVEGNILHIRGKEDSFSVDLRAETLGNICG